MDLEKEKLQISRSLVNNNKSTAQNVKRITSENG